MTTTVVSGIGRLLTNDPAHERGLTGELRLAWMVVADGQVTEVGEGDAPPADERIDVAGACVLPGFVDSHSHLVFAGDRADEFAARMAGASYQAGGIGLTVAATRAATPDALSTGAIRLRNEAYRSGTTTMEIKSGYALDVEGEALLLRVAAGLTDETTFLGAHLVPAEYEGRSDDYIAMVCGPMLDACAPHARWVDVFCERGAFDAEQSRAVLRAGRARGLGLRIHANQLGFGPGVQLAVEEGCASADHCTYLSDTDIEALAGSASDRACGRPTVATFLPACDFSTRQPYPNARRALDAGVTVALAANCNPGSSFTTSIPFCVALAVRDLHMTVDEAVWAATAGGAAALQRDDIGILRAGARADFLVLDAPSPAHFVYRPGVPLVAVTYESGRRVA